MPKKKVRSLRCPTCRKIVLRADADFPFCSDRCRMIDLGKWASGGYVVSTPINDPEALGDAETQQARYERPNAHDDKTDGRGNDGKRKH